MDLASLFATWLNYAVIGGACVVKVPQIAIIVKSRSAEGLSEVSAAMDAIAAFLFTYYNVIKRYPFSTWGEVALISIQATVILLLIWSYQPGIDLRRRWLGLAGWLGLSFLILSRANHSSHLLSMLGIAPTVLTAISRLPQIALNRKLGHTGQLSAVTYLLQFLGNCARLVTTAQLLGGDATSLFTHVSTGVMNLVIFLQILRSPAAKGLKLAAGSRSAVIVPLAANGSAGSRKQP